jgi:hypothetical protein
MKPVPITSFDLGHPDVPLTINNSCQVRQVNFTDIQTRNYQPCFVSFVSGITVFTLANITITTLFLYVEALIRFQEMAAAAGFHTLIRVSFPPFLKKVSAFADLFISLFHQR